MRIRPILVVAPLLLAGCSAGVGAEVTVGTDAGAAASVSAADLVLPLDEYSLSDAEARAIADAVIADVKACFVSYGMAASDAEPLPIAPGGKGVSGRHERRYAVADPAVAARFGYHAPSDGVDVRATFYASHTEQELHLLGGAVDGDKQSASEFRGQPLPPGGCYGQALAKYSPDEQARVAGEELVSSIQAEAWHRAQDDPRVVDVFAAWSACMAEAGYRYEAPMQANDDPAWQKEPGTPLEIATATADVECKQKVGLVGVWSSVETEIQTELIKQNQEALDAYRAALDAQVSEAEAAAG